MWSLCYRVILIVDFFFQYYNYILPFPSVSAVVIVQLLSHVPLLWLHKLQHARLPCPSPTPWVCSNSCPSSRWCRPTISSSVVPLCSCLQSFPASGSFTVSWLFASGGQSIGASDSALILSVNIQGWFPLGWTGLISLLSRGLSKVISNTMVQKRQLFFTLP